MINILVLIILILSSANCAQKDRLMLEPKSFTDLKNWPNDDHIEAFELYQNSCTKIKNSDWQNFYSALGSDNPPPTSAELKCDLLAGKKDKISARKFFEENFTPYLVKNNQKDFGMFTGYYELELNGSLTKKGKYIYPIYSKPTDLKSRVPYYSRAEIENGALAGKGYEIAYTDDPIRLFFMQIQGSGIVNLGKGKKLRLSYDGQNGYPYYPIGKYLRTVEGIDRSQLNAEFIMQYLRDYGFKAKDIMNRNSSYVFFKINHNPMHLGPTGAAGIPLTTQRSLAIDRRYIPLGSLLWLETNYPITKEEHRENFSRSSVEHEEFTKLMVTQDTGGAIKGPIRGDIFFGRGHKAEKYASYMRGIGKYYILLPNELKVSSPAN